MVRTTTTTILVLVATACGPPMVYHQPRPEEKPPPVEEPVVDYSKHGVPKRLGHEIELVGYQTIWLEGTETLITLKSTAWDEIDGVREGQAELLVENAGEKSTITIIEGTSEQVGDLTIEVNHAHELYQKGVWEPHAKLVVTR